MSYSSSIPENSPIQDPNSLTLPMDKLNEQKNNIITDLNSLSVDNIKDNPIFGHINDYRELIINSPNEIVKINNLENELNTMKDASETFVSDQGASEQIGQIIDAYNNALGMAQNLTGTSNVVPSSEDPMITVFASVMQNLSSQILSERDQLQVPIEDVEVWSLENVEVKKEEKADEAAKKSFELINEVINAVTEVDITLPYDNKELEQKVEKEQQDYKTLDIKDNIPLLAENTDKMKKQLDKLEALVDKMPVQYQNNFTQGDDLFPKLKARVQTLEDVLANGGSEADWINAYQAMVEPAKIPHPDGTEETLPNLFDRLKDFDFEQGIDKRWVKS